MDLILDDESSTLCVSKLSGHLSDFYVAPWSACLHAFRVTPGTRKAVLRPYHDLTAQMV